MKSTRILLACMVSAAATSPVFASEPTCLGLPATITATAPAVVNGTAGNDVIVVNGSTSGASMLPSVVHAGDGDDIICLSSNVANVVVGGNGIDTVSYEHAAQSVVASMNLAAVRIHLDLEESLDTSTLQQRVLELWPGADLLPTTERLYGSPQLDVLIGSVLGADEIHGAGGDDVIVGLFGNDKLYGDAGDDIIVGDGYDSVTYDPFGGWAFAGQEVPQFTTDDDELHGGDGNDSMNDDTGNNKFYGGSGNDAVAQGYGHDFLDGGPGQDLANYSQRRATVDLRNPKAQDTNHGVDTIINFEDLQGSEYGDVLIGPKTGASAIRAGAGDDFIALGNSTFAASSLLDGGPGNDGCSVMPRRFDCEFVWSAPAMATQEVSIPPAPPKKPSPLPAIPHVYP